WLHSHKLVIVVRPIHGVCPITLDLLPVLFSACLTSRA
ncbi:hypothetical protein A2U01_0111571, partial [Trifolium medium]|nr:hypothetical protein [Trifolium medium]